MTTKREVLDLHAAHPDWNSVQIADVLGCMPEYVRSTFRRNGLTLPKAQSSSAAALAAERERCARRAELYATGRSAAVAIRSMV